MLHRLMALAEANRAKMDDTRGLRNERMKKWLKHPKNHWNHFLISKMVFAVLKFSWVYQRKNYTSLLNEYIPSFIRKGKPVSQRAPNEGVWPKQKQFFSHLAGSSVWWYNTYNINISNLWLFYPAFCITSIHYLV